MTCPACAAVLAPWLTVPALEPSDARTFELLRCAACGSAVTAGEPPGPEAYATGIYAPRAPRLAFLVVPLGRLVRAQPVRLLRRAGLGPGARVLDVGAGRGRLVAALRRAGFDARGIDPSTRTQGAAPHVARGAIEDHDERDLDAAVMWHVLEHLDDPAAALRRVAGWLRPGGLLLVGVPNVASLQAAVAGPSWLHFDVPRHRVHLTPSGLAAMLRGAGLAPGHTAHMVWEHNAASMHMALLSRLGAAPGLAFHLLKRNIRPSGRDLALLALAGPPLLPVALGLEGFAAAGRRGGTVAVLARREGRA